MKWRSSIKRAKTRKILETVPKGTIKVIPKNLKKETLSLGETSSLNLKTYVSINFLEKFIKLI